jgi:hypothetical protein
MVQQFICATIAISMRYMQLVVLITVLILTSEAIDVDILNFAALVWGLAAAGRREHRSMEE